VRSLKNPLVRDLLEVSAPVSFGMFSPDKSKLVVGDASGRVFLLLIEGGEEEVSASYLKLQLPGGTKRQFRRPKPIIPHPEPAPPTRDNEGRPIKQETGILRAKAFLEEGQLVQHSNPTVGVVQGINYHKTGLFRKEAHSDDDPTKPLLAQYDALQQENVKMFPGRRRDVTRPIKRLGHVDKLHLENLSLDLNLETLSPRTRLYFKEDGVDLDDEALVYDSSYEEMLANN
jgi:hypothetical protein